MKFEHDFRTREFEPPLTDAEVEVLTYLESLDFDGIVFVRKKFGILSATAVVSSETHGGVIINVLDWSTDNVRRVTLTSSGEPYDGDELRLPNGVEHVIQYLEDGKWSTERKINPRHDLARMRDGLYRQHYASGQPTKGLDDTVRSVLVLPKMSGREANHVTDLSREGKSVPNSKVLGDDYKRNVGLAGLLRTNNGKKMDVAGSVTKLDRYLASPRTEGVPPPPLTGGAKNIADNLRNSKRRRILGSPGSGKSLGLAGRAARLALEGKSVLMVGFNITLSNYLRDLVRSRLAGRGEAGVRAFDRVTFTHFHGLVLQVVGEKFEAESDGDLDYLDRALNEAVRLYQKQERLLQAGLPLYRPLPTFDAILVDEGQDFREPWWNFLRNHVWRPDGEMAVVVDRTQDIYDHGSWMDNMNYFGAWTILKESYRLPPAVLPLAVAIAKDFSLGSAEVLPEAVPGRVSLFETTEVSWRNQSPRDLVDTKGESFAPLIAEVERLLALFGDHENCDITVLCDRHDDGLEIVKQVSEVLGVETIRHIFDSNATQQREMKLAFDNQAKGVKGCTVHSFKGWESRAVVYYLRDGTDPALAFIAVTRVKGYSEEGPSYLSVINMDERFNKYAEFATIESADPVPRKGDPPTVPEELGESY